MTSVPRPLLALLLAVAAFFAVYTFVLKPGSSSSSNAPAPTAPVKKDTTAPVHHSTSAATAVTKPATAKPATAKPATTKSAATRPATAKPATAKAASAVAALNTSPQAVLAALRAHKVIAILFYNPAASDDKAIRQELAAVPAHGGKVFKAAVPLSQILDYSVISTQVTVQTSPTLVLLGANGQASAIAGFADRFEIGQRVADVLAGS